MELASFIITNKGQALMAKLMQGTGTCDFTNIRLSSQVYSDAQIPGLTSLANVKQTAPVTKKTVVNTTSIQIEGAVDNTQLSAGYNINTIGIYATDPDEGEILYAAARAITSGYMPPYNGITVSGGVFKFVITVGASSQVTLTVDPAGYASIADIRNISTKFKNRQKIKEILNILSVNWLNDKKNPPFIPLIATFFNSDFMKSDA